MVNFYLHGDLGQVIGEKWTLNVGSPIEGLKAIDVNTKGKLRRYLNSKDKGDMYRFYIKDESNHLTREELGIPCGANDVHVVPIIEGANSGWAKIGIGVGILALAIVTGGIGSAAGGWAATAATADASGSLTVAGLFAVSISTSLILGGISQLLTPTKKNNGELDSNIFQGSVAGAQQGGCVPVIYGTALVAPIPISIKFTNVPYNTTTNTYIGTLQAIGLPGGGTEYVPGGTVPVQTTSDNG